MCVCVAHTPGINLVSLDCVLVLCFSGLLRNDNFVCKHEYGHLFSSYSFMLKCANKCKHAWKVMEFVY